MKKILKAMILAAAAFGFAFAMPAAVFADDVRVAIDGAALDFGGQPPVVVDGRTLVPARVVFEALGFTVDWEQATQTATLTNEGYMVIITIGSDVFTTNGAEFALDVPAQIIGGRTLLPIRLPLESVGFDVGWNDAARTVTIARPMAITAHGRQAAMDFLSQMTTIFEPPAFAEIVWDDRNTQVPTGRFVLGWDAETWEAITTYEVPDIYFIWNDGGFFDGHGNRINEAPWLSVYRYDIWSSYYYADSFQLFDVDNDGIPEIFVHFSQTWEGGYGGFTRVFRYVDGAYRPLENQRWLSAIHEFYIDNTGRIIAFSNSEYHGMFMYEHLVFTNTHVLMQTIVSLDDFGWEYWYDWVDHHWVEWGQTPNGWGLIDGWMFNNPTIFGTNIPLTPLAPLTTLQDEIIAALS